MADSLRAALERTGQEHLLADWGTLSTEERAELLQQLEVRMENHWLWLPSSISIGFNARSTA